MSIRSLFILSVQRKSLLYFKTFPVIEAKARRLGLQSLPPLSQEKDEGELVRGVLASLGIETPASENSHFASSALDLSSSTLPGLQITFKSVDLWPILVTEQSQILFCALPLMYSQDRELVHHLPVSAAFSFLQHVMSFVENETRLLQLESYLSVISPLGRFIGGQLPALVEKKGSTAEDVITVSVNEKVSCKNNGEETIFGTVTIDGDALSRCSRTNMSLNVALSTLHVVLHPAISIISQDKVLVDAGSSGGKVQIYYQKKSISVANLLIHDFTARRMGQSNAYKIVLGLSIKKFPDAVKLKVSQFSFHWKIHPSDMYRLSNILTNHGIGNQEPMGLVWNLGSKMPRSGRAVLTADVYAPNGISDFVAAANFRMENVSEAFILTRDGITVNDTIRTCKLLLEKNMTSADYRMHFGTTAESTNVK